MERQPIILPIDFFQKKMNSLYYKKIIHKKKDNDSYFINNNILNYYHEKHSKSLADLPKLNIDIHKPNHSSSKKNSNSNKKIYKKVILPYINLNSLIQIQKLMRGFFARKKFKQLKSILMNKKYNTANQKSFQKNMNIFEAIKNNSKNRKKCVKKANNQYNLRNTFNVKINKNNIYRKNIILINNKSFKNKNYSFDYKDNNKKQNKKNLKTIKKIECEYQKSLHENEFFLNNFFNEQSPKKIKYENNINEVLLLNGDNVNENFKNKKICQTEVNIEQNIILNRCFNKNKKNLIILDNNKNPSYFSSYQTKENTSSERNLNGDNSSNLDLNTPFNKNNKKVFVKKNKCDNLDKINNKKKEITLDKDLKEFDSDNLYQKNKDNINLIKTNNKYNFNPLINSNYKLKNNNNKNKISKNDFNSKFQDNLFLLYKNKMTTDHKQKNIFDNDLKSLKSSFYDEDEFIIINYDYSLNDKKKLKVMNVENINLNGKQNKTSNFLKILKNNIYKSSHLYAFKLMKDYNIEEKEDEKSMTDNESCSYLSQGRIEKNNIIFNHVQNHIKNNCFII